MTGPAGTAEDPGSQAPAIRVYDSPEDWDDRETVKVPLCKIGDPDCEACQ